MVKLTKSEIFEKTIITAIDSINLRRLMAIMPDEIVNDFSDVLMASQRRRFFYFRGKQIPVNSIVHAGNQGSILIISTEEAQKIFTEYNPINLDELNKLIETKLGITEFAAYDATIQTAINRKADASSVAGKLDKVDFEQYPEAINQVVDSKVNSNIFEDFVEGVNGSFSQLQNKINHKADISSVAGKLDKDVFEENKIINDALFNQKLDKSEFDNEIIRINGKLDKDIFNNYIVKQEGVYVNVLNNTYSQPWDLENDVSSLIQNLIDVVPDNSTLYFPYGLYKIDNTVNITKPLALKGHGVFTSYVPLANSMTYFNMKSGNITFEDLTFENTVNTETTTSGATFIGINNGENGVGPGVYENFKIINCKFYNPFYAVDFRMEDSLTTEHAYYKNIEVKGCYVKSSIQTSSGALNFRSNGDIKNRVIDVIVSGCVVDGGKTASSYNFIGVKNLVVDGNIGRDNRYAGIEVENGCLNAVLSNNILIDCQNPIWVDDCIDVVVEGNVLTSNVADTYKRGVYVTIQHHSVKNIIIKGNKIHNGVIEFANFGTSVAEGVTMENIIVDSNIITNDVKGRAVSISTWLKTATISNNRLQGFIRVVRGNDTYLKINDNFIDGDGTNIIEALGTKGKLFVSDNMCINGTLPTNVDLRDNMVDGSIT